jgi:hypothetical protein
MEVKRKNGRRKMNWKDIGRGRVVGFWSENILGLYGMIWKETWTTNENEVRMLEGYVKPDLWGILVWIENGARKLSNIERTARTMKEARQLIRGKRRFENCSSFDSQLLDLWLNGDEFRSFCDGWFRSEVVSQHWNRNILMY